MDTPTDILRFFHLDRWEQAFDSIPATRRRVPHLPDFLCSFVGSQNFMRLSLKKAAHAVLSRAAYRKFGASRSFSRDMGYRRPLPQACYGPHGSVGVPENEGEAHQSLSFQTLSFVH
jgi:hypothetical protein